MTPEDKRKTIMNPARVRWGCRRGMLELDYLLLSFFEDYYMHLSEHEKMSFVSFLEEEDNRLYQWLVKRERSPFPEEYRFLLPLILPHE
jgi:antitoxin CptB